MTYDSLSARSYRHSMKQAGEFYAPDDEPRADTKMPDPLPPDYTQAEGGVVNAAPQRIRLKRDEMTGGYFWYDEEEKIGLDIMRRDGKWRIRGWFLIDGYWERRDIIATLVKHDTLREVRKWIADALEDRAEGKITGWWGEPI